MNNLTKLIASYLVKPQMKLLDWIKINNIELNLLSENPNAIDLLEQNKNKIVWASL